jgi:hypothetical protein
MHIPPLKVLYDAGFERLGVGEFDDADRLRPLPGA